MPGQRPGAGSPDDEFGDHAGGEAGRAASTDAGTFPKSSSTPCPQMRRADGKVFFDQYQPRFGREVAPDGWFLTP